MPPQSTAIAKQKSLALDDNDMGPPAPPSAYGQPSPATTPTGGVSGATPISHISAEQEKVKVIRDAIRAEDKRLRAAYPFPLGHEWQDACGLVIYLGKRRLGLFWDWTGAGRSSS